MMMNVRKLALILGVSYVALFSALADGRAVLPPQSMVQEYLQGKPSFVTRDDIVLAMGVLPGFGPMGAFMAGGAAGSNVLFVNSVYGSSADMLNSGATVSVPSGTSVGDLMIMFAFASGSSSDPLSVPSGWTSFGSSRAPTGALARLNYRFRQAGDSSWTCFDNEGQRGCAAIVSYSGAVGVETASWSTVGNITPTITATNSGVLLSGAVNAGFDNSGPPPSGTNLRIKNGTSGTTHNMMMCDLKPSPPGLSTSQTYSLSGGGGDSDFQMQIY